MGFAQATDHKGQPQHEIRGGQLTIVLSESADPNLYDWAKRSTKLKSGDIIFDTQMSGSVLKINFTNAYCIKLAREIDERAGTKTVLVIAPEQIKLNDVTHNNYWKK